MVQTHWHIRITIESSTKDRARELAQAERRTVANYVGALIEQDQKQRQEGTS